MSKTDFILDMDVEYQRRPDMKGREVPGRHEKAEGGYAVILGEKLIGYIWKIDTSHYGIGQRWGWIHTIELDRGSETFKPGVSKRIDAVQMLILERMGWFAASYQDELGAASSL